MIIKSWEENLHKTVLIKSELIKLKLFFKLIALLHVKSLGKQVCILSDFSKNYSELLKN